MDFSNYDGLKTEVANWMARSDLSGSAAGFIQLAEARLNRKLPLREMWATEPLVGTISSRAIALPTDYVEPGYLRLTTFNDCRDPITPYTKADLPYHTIAGTPCGWAIDGANIALDRPCDQAHTFDFWYRQKFALSDDNPTNWLLTNHPDVYLAAVLVWGGMFKMKPEEAATWKGILDEAIEELAWVESRGDANATLKVDAGLTCRGNYPSYSSLINGDF